MKTIKPRGTTSILTDVSPGMHSNYEPYKRYISEYLDESYKKHISGHLDDSRFEEEAKSILDQLDKISKTDYTDCALKALAAKLKEAHYNQVQLDKFFGITK